MDPRTVKFLAEMEREHGAQIAEVIRRFIVGEIEYTQRPSSHVDRGWTTGDRSSTTHTREKRKR